MNLEPRHFTFIGLAVVVIGAMLLNFQPEIRPSDETRKMFDYIDSLPEGSLLLISFDHEASSLPEVKPLAQAMLRHIFRRNLRPVGIALLAEGTGVGYGLMNSVAAEFDKQYGQDYAYLGFKPQFVAAILSMGESIRETFPEDYSGRPYAELPLLTTVENYDDIVGVVSVADGSMVTHWVEYGNGRYGVTVSAFVAAAMVTTYDPYVASGQMYGMVGGLRGAAEYETLLGEGGSGKRGMLAQTSMHLYIILLVALGNIIYFRQKRKGRA